MPLLWTRSAWSRRTLTFVVVSACLLEKEVGIALRKRDGKLTSLGLHGFRLQMFLLGIFEGPVVRSIHIGLVRSRYTIARYLSS